MNVSLFLNFHTYECIFELPKYSEILILFKHEFTLLYKMDNIFEKKTTNMNFLNENNKN